MTATTATFTVSAAHSARVIETGVVIERVAELLGLASPLTANADLALVRALDVRESVEVARFAYRVFRVS